MSAYLCACGRPAAVRSPDSPWACAVCLRERGDMRAWWFVTVFRARWSVTGAGGKLS